jgi:hypothetical protein
VTRSQERREWKHRLGRFRECERDTDERQQVMPGPEIPVSDQTHTLRGRMREHGDTSYMDA